ncbi:MAG: type IV toxin-antitoxin system AbiEi family antitoxin domain-containing protein [Actinomycetota bacterium]
MNSDRTLAEIAAAQGGAIRREQALATGLSKGQIDRRVRDGRWDPIGYFGYRIIDMPGATNLVRAAVATLPNAVVSHDSAAEIHDMDKLRRGRAAVLVHSRTTHEFPGVTVHRCHDLLDEHIVEIDDLPVTTIPRTIVDLSRFLTTRHLTAVLASAVTNKQTTVDAVQNVVDQVAQRGKPGIRKIRWVLEDRQIGPREGTPLERLGAQVLREGGLPEPRFEYPIPWNPDRRFDAAYPRSQLAIEWDSRRWHELLEAFTRDRERDRQALLHGWRLVRFTWIDVTRSPQEVVSTVRDLLEG